MLLNRKRWLDLDPSFDLVFFVLSQQVHESLHIALTLVYWFKSSKKTLVSSWYQKDPTRPSLGSDGKFEKSVIVFVWLPKSWSGKSRLEQFQADLQVLVSVSHTILANISRYLSHSKVKEKKGLTFVTTTTEHSVLQIQQRRSPNMKRRRTTHVEQTSRWPQDP